MAFAFCLFNPKLAVNIYLELANVRVFNSKIFIMINLKNPESLICTNCWKTKHTRPRCTLDTFCKECKQPGHTPDDKTRLHYEPQKLLTPFCGEDVLSNFFPCELDFCGMKHKSAEHAFQYIKAVRFGDRKAANIIKDATGALFVLRHEKKNQNEWTIGVNVRVYTCGWRHRMLCINKMLNCSEQN